VFSPEAAELAVTGLEPTAFFGKQPVSLGVGRTQLVYIQPPTPAPERG
jgi:hypothetical protein